MNDPESPFSQTKVIAIYSEPILLNVYYNKSYQEILTLSDMPPGPLRNMVARISTPRLSEFHPLTRFAPPSHFSSTCVYALCRYPTSSSSVSMKTTPQMYLGVEDMPSVYGYLLSNGYKLLHELTHMSNLSSVDVGGGQRRLICMFSM